LSGINPRFAYSVARNIFTGSQIPETERQWAQLARQEARGRMRHLLVPGGSSVSRRRRSRRPSAARPLSVASAQRHRILCLCAHGGLTGVPQVSIPGTSPEIAAGKTIFTEGIPSEGVPPCVACHGEHAEGNGPIPRLAGQHEDYLASQLEAYASTERANEVMREISKDMTAEQISEVTAYLATL
jgi:cytochrome c553